MLPKQLSYRKLSGERPASSESNSVPSTATVHQTLKLYN